MARHLHSLAAAEGSAAMKNLDKKIQDLIQSNATPTWIAEAMKIALSKDCVDAANCFETAARLFNERAINTFGDEDKIK